MLAELGVRQATLSLEAALAQCVAVCAATPLPIEAIVHGSLPGMVLCQCVIAAVTMNSTPDDPCRAPCQTRQYGLRDRLGQVHPIEPDQYCINHLMMGKDLCAVKHIEPFLLVGFASLRLEMPYSSAEQAATTTALYRKALDRFAEGRRGCLVSDDEFAALQGIWPRPFSLGAYANPMQSVAAPDGALPTNLIVRYHRE
jgi:putative protease